MKYIRTTDAATEPISQSELKTHLRVDHTDEDTYITGIITAARQVAENYCERSFITQTWKLYGSEWPSIIEIPRGKTIAVTSIKYSATTLLDTTISSGDYNVSSETDIARIKPDDEWPDTEDDFVNSWEVEYTAGYGAAGTVPDAIKQAIYIIASDMYEARKTHSPTRAVTVQYMGKPIWQYLLDQYRIIL